MEIRYGSESNHIVALNAGIVSRMSRIKENGLNIYGISVQLTLADNTRALNHNIPLPTL